MTDFPSLSFSIPWFLLVVNVLLQVTLLAGGALLAANFLRRDPATRHGILCSSLVLVLVSPATAFLFQSMGGGLLTIFEVESLVQVREVPSVARAQLAAADSETEPFVTRLADGRVQATEPTISSQQAMLHDRTELGRLPLLGSAESLPAGAPVTGDRVAISAPGRAERPQPAGLFVRRACFTAITIWFVGVVLLTVRMLIGRVRLAEILRAAVANSDESIAQLHAGVCRRLGVIRPPELLISSRVSGPMATGLIRPKVILPEDLAGRISRSQCEQVLLHEVSHIARRDQAVTLLQNGAAAFLWPHPLVWVLNRRLAQSREEVCDNYVLASSDGVSYSRTLLALAEHIRSVTPHPGTSGLFTANWRLESRVADLLDENRIEMTHLSGGSKVLVAMLMLAMLVGARFGTLQPSGISADANRPFTHRVTEPTTTSLSRKPIVRIGQTNPQDSWGAVEGFTAGQQLITSFPDGAIAFWNLNAQQLAWKIPEASGQKVVALSQSARHLLTRHASADHDNVLTLHDLEARSVEWRARFKKFDAAAVSSEANLVAVLQSHSLPVRLLELDSGEVIGSLYADTSLQDYVGLAFSRDGRFLAAAVERNRAGVWDLWTGTYKSLPAVRRRSSLRALSFLDDRRLVGGCFATVDGKSTTLHQVWDVTTQQLEFELLADDLPSRDPQSLVSNDGKTIVTNHQDRVVLWDAASRTRSLELELPSGDAVMVRLRGRALSPDNQTLVANRGNSLLMWDLTSGRRLDNPTIKHSKDVTGIAISTDGALVVSTGSDGAVYLWDGRSGRRQKKLLQVSIGAKQAEFLANESQVVIAGERRTAEDPSIRGFVQIIDVNDGRTVRRWDLNGRCFGMRLSDDRRLLAIASGASRVAFGGRDRSGGSPPQIAVWDLQADSESDSLCAKLTGFTPDSNGKITIDQDGQEVTWMDGRGVTGWKVGDRRPAKITDFHDSGNVLAKYVTNRQEKLSFVGLPERNRRSGHVYATFVVSSRMGERPRYCVCLDPDDGTVVWEKKYEMDLVRHLLCSPDGRVLAIGLGGGQSMASHRIVFVEASTGKELDRLSTAELGSVSALQFSRDGRRLYTGRVAGDLLVWDVSAAYEMLGE